MANLNPRRRTAGLSLIELLVAMVVVVIVGALLLPGVQGMMRSTNLNGGATVVLAQMDLARQTAATRNVPVDLRFYQDTSGTKDSNENFPYHIMSLVIPATASGTGSDRFVAEPYRVPGDIVFDSRLQYSSLLNTQLGAAGLQPTTATELESAPLAVRGLPYVQCVFLANGTVNLDSSQKWCITLLNGNLLKGGTATTPAADFVTIILDPQTSHVREYQP